MIKQSMFDTVQYELMAVEKELAFLVSSRTDLVSEIGGHLLGAGGKRLRPALYFLCAGARDNDLAKKLPVAAAIELIHMATLVHDDVIDNAATRRAKPTANACWGNHAAVLAGDFLFAKAFSLVADLEKGQYLKILTDTICTICEGEISQSRELFNAEVTEEEYTKIIGQKTAEFIGISCKLGAMVAGAESEDAESLYKYGYFLGIAFQIIDDILDFTALPEQVGKPTCNDLRQGLLTLPAIYALRNSNLGMTLKNIIQNKDMSESNLKQCLAIIFESKAIEYCYQRAANYLQLAKNNLPESLNDKARKSLAEIADLVGIRKY